MKQENKMQVIPPKKPPACADCTHYFGKYKGIHTCMRGALKHVDPVDGSVRYEIVLDCHAERERTPTHYCGEEGRFYKPASAWQRLKQLFGYE